MQKILENALEIGRKYIPEGECASYIPELAKADKNHLGVCIRTRGMETFPPETRRSGLRSRVSPK